MSAGGAVAATVSLAQRLSVRCCVGAGAPGKKAAPVRPRPAVGAIELHHVGILCENIERSLEFYQGVLGLELNPDRPDDRLPYDGAWLWTGTSGNMVHLMELPNPDPIDGRPEHGGRDRHTAFVIADIDPLVAALEAEGVSYTMSKSGRRAVFCRDPDGNALEFMET